MREVGEERPEVPAVTPDDLPVESMDYTVEEHYRGGELPIPATDHRHFDGDLRTIFGSPEDAPAGEEASAFLRKHRREIVSRVAYWTGEGTAAVRRFVDLLVERSEVLELRVRGLEASTLIELTAFGTAVMMNFRYTDALDGVSREGTQ